ncbi:hypothetical protein TeGR_g8227 [Tetraparma gracilis]|uniref:Trigger factor ribosome-binding bacterial domain-containing protein n=1 Tax=Tetraparma gracilis TaxID=2962635 RepID=A0ABQ6M8E4_9STRA|nr:hypothetical protein TeGR_g8227 [Tetraparma gracilis]
MLSIMLCLILLLLAASTVTSFAPASFARLPLGLRASPPEGTPPEGTPLPSNPFQPTWSCIETSPSSFWLSATALSPAILKTRDQVVREASSKAQFPGFRKGQIPPYAMPEMSAFAVEESVTNVLKEAVEGFGIKVDGKVEVIEDMKKAGRAWKKGADIQFTATFNGERISPPDEPAAADAEPAAAAE